MAENVSYRAVPLFQLDECLPAEHGTILVHTVELLAQMPKGRYYGYDGKSRKEAILAYIRFMGRPPTDVYVYKRRKYSHFALYPAEGSDDGMV